MCEFTRYSSEEALARAAIDKVDRDIVLSLSPGGSMTTDQAAWLARGGGDGGTVPMASMYRVTGDFHSSLDFQDIPQHAYMVGNLTAAGPNGDLIGANGSWPDLDLVDLGECVNYPPFLFSLLFWCCK